MPSRLRLRDFMLSRGPGLVGLCQSDVPGCAAMVNAVQERLLTCREVGDHGWNGTWAEMVFNVPRGNPYLTTPRDVARIEWMDVCKRPVPVQNQFYEYLLFGNGRMPRGQCLTQGCCDLTEGFARNNAVTFRDVSAGDSLRVYLSDAGDEGKLVLVSGNDANGQPVTSLDGLVQVNGVYATLQAPFVDVSLNGVPVAWSGAGLSGIQKDVSIGPVTFYGVNPVSGAQTALLTMEPGEQVASYRRYFLNGLARQCCPPAPGQPNTAQVHTIVKRDFIPVIADTDYLLLTSLEAMICEAQAVRFESMDSGEAKQSALERHRAAVRFLQGELAHYQGKDQPAVNFAPFGTAHLRHQRIGAMM